MNIYQEQRSPENQISRRDDHVHFDPSDSFCFQMLDVALDLDTLRRSDGEQVLTILDVEKLYFKRLLIGFKDVFQKF